MNHNKQIIFKQGWDELTFEEKRAARILSGRYDLTRSTCIAKHLDRGLDITLYLLSSLSAKGFLEDVETARYFSKWAIFAYKMHHEHTAPKFDSEEQLKKYRDGKRSEEVYARSLSILLDTSTKQLDI